MRMIRKKGNHTLHTNLRHRKIESWNTNSLKTSGKQLNKATSSLLPIKIIAKLERILSTAQQTNKKKTDQTQDPHKQWEQQLH